MYCCNILLSNILICIPDSDSTLQFWKTKPAHSILINGEANVIFRICSILNTVQCIHSSIADWDDISPYNKILNSNPDFQTKHDDAVRNLQNLSQNIIRILVYNAVDSDVW